MKTKTDNNLSSVPKLEGLNKMMQWDKLILDTWSALENKTTKYKGMDKMDLWASAVHILQNKSCRWFLPCPKLLVS